MVVSQGGAGTDLPHSHIYMQIAQPMINLQAGGERFHRSTTINLSNLTAMFGVEP
jgi:hypothetical protein